MMQHHPWALILSSSRVPCFYWCGESSPSMVKDIELTQTSSTTGFKEPWNVIPKQPRLPFLNQLVCWVAKSVMEIMNCMFSSKYLKRFWFSNVTESQLHVWLPWDCLLNPLCPELLILKRIYHICPTLLRRPCVLRAYHWTLSFRIFWVQSLIRSACRIFSP
jgi:hypothetical protein